MPYTTVGFLLHKVFLQDQTALRERKSQFTVAPTAEETILLFRTDGDLGSFAAYFQIPHKDKRSDLMVVQLKHRQDRIVGHRILFVELKSGGDPDAVDQLDRVVRAVLPSLRRTFGDGFVDPDHLRALVVSPKGPPNDQFHAKQQEFLKKHRFSVFHCRPNEDDIRKHLA
jgi:hypothetical protein